MRALTIFCILAVAAAPLTAKAQCDAGEKVLTFSHVEPARGNPKGEAAATLSERVNMELDGRACMEVTANATDHTAATVIDGLLEGRFDFAATQTGNLTPLSARFQIYDLPFLFDDIEAVLGFQRSTTGRKLLSEAEGAGVKGLAFWLDGFKQMTANRAIVAPEDVAGLRFQASESEVERAYFQLLDAEPVSVPRAELREAIEAGRIDGQNSTWSTVSSQRLAGVQSGFTETRHAVVQYMLLTSNDFWEQAEPARRQDRPQSVTHAS